MGIIGLVLTIFNNDQITIALVIPTRVGDVAIHRGFDFRADRDAEIQTVVTGVKFLGQHPAYGSSRWIGLGNPIRDGEARLSPRFGLDLHSAFHQFIEQDEHEQGRD